ncbi:hypothetical protein Bpfe_010917 [Biomphalaria pfeifferi]|uniref:TNF family profile domain-containing protein n=1 Tax=Biomphalaria pfeifferi TaxID=112525 RepID=A0AAD8FE09_BIOPF|nr:hypothetical protein Bpfe_010917 [Biomphalaria pfeifferi]
MEHKTNSMNKESYVKCKGEQWNYSFDELEKKRNFCEEDELKDSSLMRGIAKSRRCRAKSVLCFGLPVYSELIVCVITILLGAVIGLVVVVCSLHGKVNELKTIVQSSGNNATRLERLYEAFNLADETPEAESLYDKTMNLISSSDDDETLESDMEPTPTTWSETTLVEDTESVNDGDDENELDTGVANGESMLSRNRRDLGPDFKKSKNGSSKKNNGKGNNLETAHFEMNFFLDWYDYKTNFTFHECIGDTRWPTVPIACRGQTLKYPNSDSPLAFYLPSKPANETSGNRKKNRKSGKPLMEITNQKEGIFGVRESGIYLIHLNIIIVDESQTHSLGISLNNQTVLSCPKGGFRCPHLNSEGSYKYRICVIDGVLEINAEDQLQIKTMEKDTMVRFEQNRKSQFKAVLLHTMPSKTRT